MALYVVNALDGHGAFSATVSEANGIDAGQFVKATSTEEITATGTVVDKILISICDAAGDEDTCVGIAIEDGDNGEVISVATRGIFRCPMDSANGAITAGMVVQVGDQATIGYKIEKYDATDGARPLGQALTPGDTDDDYVTVRMEMGNGAGAV